MAKESGLAKSKVGRIWKAFGLKAPSGRYVHLRHGITTLFATLDVAVGEVYGSIHRRRRGGRIHEVPHHAGRPDPRRARCAPGMRHYATHKAPAVVEWLDAHPRFHMHFTPTYAAWLNQVERWFALLTDKKLRRGAHRSIDALENGIRDWINTWKTPRRCDGSAA
jgi:transposase